ncbi:MAG: hypothetical protein V2A54_05555 [Bacteroidota bacterium]
MKKSLSIILIFATLTAISFTGCRKYEEGPSLSLSSKKSRVCGVWQVEKEITSTNGTIAEVTSDPDWENSFIEYTKDGIVKITAASSSGSFSVEGTWKFGSNKETIETSFGSGSLASNSSVVIIRLKGKELWVRDYDNNGNDNYYEVHYKAK